MKITEKESTIIHNRLAFRTPHVNDGANIWNLVRSTGVLDLNSAYSYLMLCKYFTDTCVVAEAGNKIVGFLSAFRPPVTPEVIFVWQVGVDESQRGKGLGTKLLKELLQREKCNGVQYLETTVTPSNIPSHSLFCGLARDLGTGCEISDCFPAYLFPEKNHEDELLYRIGPLRQNSERKL